MQRSRSNVIVTFLKNGCFGDIRVSQTHLVYVFVWFSQSELVLLSNLDNTGE